MPVPAGWGGNLSDCEITCHRKAQHTGRYVCRALLWEHCGLSFLSTSLPSLLTVQAAS